jgi:hypothetical protein
MTLVAHLVSGLTISLTRGKSNDKFESSPCNRPLSPPPGGGGVEAQLYSFTNLGHS